MLIEAYIDETGTNREDAAICLAAYLLKPDAGMAMQAKWEEVLAEYQLPFFHMTDCAHFEVCEPYKSLGRQRCIDLATELIGLIKGYCLRGTVVSFNPRHYIPPANYEHGRNDPYSFAVSVLVYTIQAGLKYNRYNGDISFVLESGHASQKLARAALDKLSEEAEQAGRPFASTFQSKTQACLLQAADILAWHSQKHIKRTLAGEPIRKDFLALMHVQHEMLHFSNPLENGVPDWESTRITQVVDIAGHDQSRDELIRSIYSFS